jgi:hypothetical protein
MDQYLRPGIPCRGFRQWDGGYISCSNLAGYCEVGQKSHA